MTTHQKPLGRIAGLLPMGLSYLASGGSLIASSAAQLVTFAILARALGVVEFSYFIALTAITAVALQLCGLGAQESLVRRVAQDRALYPAMLGHNIILSAATGSVLVLAGLLVLPAIFTLSENPLVNLVAIAQLLIANIVLARVILAVEQIFIAHSDFLRANRNVLSFAVGRLAAAVLGCLVFGVDNLVDWAIWSFVAHLVVAALAIRSVRRLGAPRFELRREEIANGVMFSTPFILKAIRQNVDLLVLAALTSSEIVASYGVARRIVESGYLSVEALHRLLYPGSAAATVGGLRHAVTRFRQMLVAGSTIGLLTAVAVFVCAPILPLLFGEEYVSLTFFTRVLAPSIVLMAIYATALEALGAGGRHIERGAVLNVTAIVGVGLVAVGTWALGITGTFIATYVIEIATALASWIVLVRLIRREKTPPAPSPGRPHAATQETEGAR